MMSIKQKNKDKFVIFEKVSKFYLYKDLSLNENVPLSFWQEVTKGFPANNEKDVVFIYLAEKILSPILNSRQWEIPSFHVSSGIIMSRRIIIFNKSFVFNIDINFVLSMYSTSNPELFRDVISVIWDKRVEKIK